MVEESPTEALPVSPETPVRKPISRALIVAGSVLLLALAVVIAFLVIPKSGTNAAAPTPTSVSSPSATPSRTPSPTPTPTQAAPPVVAAPADPVDPAPAEPEPADPAPADPGPPPLPPPPAPIIPPLSIDSMDAYPLTTCEAHSWITISWATTGALANSAEMRIKSGGGTPVFDQVWSHYPTTTTDKFLLDCTRPLWYFTLTVSDGVTTKTARLTFAHGVNQGWYSVAP